MGVLRDLKDKVEGTVDEVAGKSEGGLKGGMRVLKGKTKKGLAETRSDTRQSYRADEVDDTVL